MVFWVYIISPTLYYTNVWNSAYLPIQSNSVYDNSGNAYNVSRVINKQNGYQLDPLKYEQYSRVCLPWLVGLSNPKLTQHQIYLPVTYALNQFGLAFATIVSLFIWLLLEKRGQLWSAVSRITCARRKEATNHDEDRPAYAETPTWWYWATAAFSLFLAIFCCEYWKVQLPWYGVLLAFAVAAVFFVPVREANASTKESF